LKPFHFHRELPARDGLRNQIAHVTAGGFEADALVWNERRGADPLSTVAPLYRDRRPAAADVAASADMNEPDATMVQPPCRPARATYGACGS
jgi:hypothetical protein